jgi:hypothetical protein
MATKASTPPFKLEDFLSEALSEQEIEHRLMARFIGIYRRYGGAPIQVRINGEKTFLTYLQYDQGDVLTKMCMRAYLSEPEAHDFFTFNEFVELRDEARRFVAHNKPNHIYIPKGDLWYLHHFVETVMPTYFNIERVTRSSNQHLQIQGKDLFTLCKTVFRYLSHTFLAKACRIFGKDVRYRLSFAKMLFARIRNEKNFDSEKSPCSKPLDGSIFRVVMNMLLINNRLVPPINLDNKPYILPDNLKRPERAPSEPDDNDSEYQFLECSCSRNVNSVANKLTSCPTIMVNWKRSICSVFTNAPNYERDKRRFRVHDNTIRYQSIAFRLNLAVVMVPLQPESERNSLELD